MRKLFYIAMALFVAITVNTSCGVNGDDAKVYTTMATVIEGTSSIPYSLVFDDGKTAYVTNTNKWSPSFSETQKELRYIVSYTIINETSSIFDMEVELVDVTPIATQKNGLRYVTATDFTGDSGLQNYTSGVAVDVCFLSPARNYITLMLSFNCDYAYIGTPKLSLTKNEDIANSPYKDLYTADDGYFYLELYHDNSDYSGSYSKGTYWSCKMPSVTTIKSLYNGVKIISINPNTNHPEVYTFNFTSEN